MAAIDAITGVGTRDTIGRLPDRVRTDNQTRADQIQADEDRAKQIEQDKQDELDQIEKAAADKDLQRTEAKKQAEKQQQVEQEAQREAAQVQARRQADLERLERVQENREAERALQNQSERARLEGVSAYRAQTERVQTLSATDRLSAQQVQAEPTRTLRSQLTAFESTRIDKIDLSDIARARLQGAVGLTIIQPTGTVSGAELTA
jgi:hypothetical protein